MSFDYYVAVHRNNWPTSKSVQAHLQKLGYPVALVTASDEMFSIAEGSFSLPVVFEGREVALESAMEQVVDAHDDDSLYGLIAQCIAPNFTLANGDYVLTLTFRSNSDEIRAGLYLASAMILAFNGYGFENQAETHGAAEFAERMLEEASNPSLWT